MVRINKGMLAVAALAAVVTFSMPSFARADIEIALSEDGFDAGNGVGVRKVVATGASFSLGGAVFSGTFGDFTISNSSGTSDNGTNGGNLSDVLTSTTSVQNNHLVSAGTHTLHVYVTQDGYSLPIGALLSVESGLGGSVNSPTLTLTNIFQAFADKNNNLFGMADFQNAAQTASQTGSTFDTGSRTGLFSRTNPLYSLTTEANITLTDGGKANYSSHENVTAVPAPAGLVLVASGMPALALGWLRRRKVKNS
jgi:hypothetical protein